jgi:solute:Na+ symporter, SSS family
MTIIDALIVVAFLVYVVVVGLRDRHEASSGPEQYFLAGRSLNGWQAGISMAATQFAADTPLLVTGLVAVGGIFALWRLWIYALAFLLMAFVLAACWRRSGVLTDAEFAELRYGGRGAAPLRLFKALYFGTVFNCFALAIVLLAATRIAEPFLLWHEWLPGGLFESVQSVVRQIDFAPTTASLADPQRWIKAADNTLSVLFIALITLFYSTLGGLRSVVKTDVVQFAIMMVASIIYATVVVQEVGGLESMIGKLNQAYSTSGPGINAAQLLAFTPSAAYDVSALLLAVVFLQWLIQVNADGTGYLAQRAMACRSDHEARRAAVVFTFAQVLFRSLVWLPLALGLLLLFPPGAALGGEAYVAEREATFVRGIAETLPAGLKGLMLTGMIAALASTVDTHLNWGSSYWTNDIYLRFVCRFLRRQPSPRELVWVARASNVLILAIALAIMAQLESIKVAWESSLLLGAGVGAVLVLRWLWWRMTAWGELAAIAGSALLVPLTLILIPDELAALRMLLVAVCSTAAAVGTSLWFQPVLPRTLVDFYRRVRPPGFWGPVAREAGEHEHAPLVELERGTAAMLLGAVSTFCLLIGLGTWLLQATPPVWLPERNVWIAFNLTLGLALVPFWLRLGFRKSAGERE